MHDESARLARLEGNGMGSVIGEVLPFAVGLAIIPIPIIAVILMLLTPRARTNGPAFLAGWIVGLLAVGSIALAIGTAADVGSDEGASDVMSWVFIVLGILLLALAGRRVPRARAARAQGETADPAELPTWMRGLETFTAPRSFAVAVALSAMNPKNLVLVFGAGATIARADLGGTESVAALLVFVALASVTVAVPVVYYYAAGDRADRTLDAWKAWLVTNNQTVMVALFVVFGVVLIGQGARQLAA